MRRGGESTATAPYKAKGWPKALAEWNTGLDRPDYRTIHKRLSDGILLAPPLTGYDETMSDEKRPPQPDNVVVVFRLSDSRLKAKKDAAKARREFIRDRIREKTSG